MSHIIGVCSWSLRAANPAELVDRLRQCDLNAVQLALDPIRRGEWDEGETLSRLIDAGVTILSGMMGMKDEDYGSIEKIRATGGVRPDQHWKANLESASLIADMAQRMRIGLVTFHAGFLPHHPNDPTRPTMLERLAQIAGVFSKRQVAVALETGQESADTMLTVLGALAQGGARIGVNFDPANMILYDMGEPVRAIQKLAPMVRQIHIKDALPTNRPGTWGKEMPVGEGAVNWPGFFEVVRKKLPDVNLVIEREAKQERMPDIIAARDLIRKLLAEPAKAETAT
jgi:sugar phosphate isomerase/epimerase